MNLTILKGRLVAEPEITHTTGENPTLIARYRLAVNRKYKREGQPEADFINFVCFGKNAEFVQKYLKKGAEILTKGYIQTGSYTANDGSKRYTTDIIVEEHEFCGSKASNGQALPTDEDGFVAVEDDDSLPF